jgi:hypothetical protein
VVIESQYDGVTRLHAAHLWSALQYVLGKQSVDLEHFRVSTSLLIRCALAATVVLIEVACRSSTAHTYVAKDVISARDSLAIVVGRSLILPCTEIQGDFQVLSDPRNHKQTVKNTSKTPAIYQKTLNNHTLKGGREGDLLVYFSVRASSAASHRSWARLLGWPAPLWSAAPPIGLVSCQVLVVFRGSVGPAAAPSSA